MTEARYTIGEILQDDQHVIITHTASGTATVSRIIWNADSSVTLTDAFTVRTRTVTTGLYSIPGTVWREGTQLASFDLSLDCSTPRTNDYDASALLASYILTLVTSGGIASYNRDLGEYKVDMPDGSAEYLKGPIALGA